MLPVDSGGGGGNNGGGSITSNQTRTIVVQWALAPGCPVPDYFQVIGYTGSDPTATAAYLWAPAVKLTPAAAAKNAVALGTTQPYAVSIKYGLSATPGAVTAAVASEYLSGTTQSQVPIRTTPTPLSTGRMP